MYKCSCNLVINPIKFPNNLKSKKHKNLSKNNHPFLILKQNNFSKEQDNNIINELIK